MLAASTQLRRHLAVHTPLGLDALLLLKFSGREELSRLFEFELEMLSDDDALPPRELVGRDVSFRVNLPDGDVRWFNGYVNDFENAGRSEGGTSYRATVVPWLWFLTQTTDCRIFQHRSTPQIVEQIFADLGFSHFRFALRQEYAPREYCVQYRETDFAFVSRLLEEEGIYYYFEHEQDRHTLVITDHADGGFALAERVSYSCQLGTNDSGDPIKSWRHAREYRPGRFAHADFNFQTPRVRLRNGEVTATALTNAKAFEIYDYPGCFVNRERGQSSSLVRMQEIESTADRIEGTSVCRTFAPGGSFTIDKHQIGAEVGREYRLIAVEHEASVDGTYLTGTGVGGHRLGYENRFSAIPAETPFRPARTTPRPIVEGPQTAVVVGPPGEEIWPDEFGRVKVQFHWDREGQRNENSSCWIRASQSHAGSGWGSMDLPRVGQEVIVAFLEGDPDRPIIKGRTYNGATRPPFGLPAGKTRSGMKSNTHKGSGYNEVTMDDTAGQEQLRTHAQHNMDSVVGNNQTLKVGVDRTTDVVNDDTLRIGNNLTESIGVNKNVTVGTHVTEEIGEHVVIDAGTSITLQCGASTIHMNQAGVIKISGSFVATTALVNCAMLAPQTEVSGEKALLQLGLVNLALGGIVHVKGKESCEVAGATVNLESGGETILMGTPLKLGEVAPPPPVPPPPPPAVPPGGGPSGPAAPAKKSGTPGDANQPAAEPSANEPATTESTPPPAAETPPEQPVELPASTESVPPTDSAPQSEIADSPEIVPDEAGGDDSSQSEGTAGGEAPPAPEEEEGWGSWISSGLDWVPGVSSVKSGVEALTGRDYIAGRDLSETERLIAAAGLIPYGKIVGKAGKAIAKVADKSDDLLENAAKKSSEGGQYLADNWHKGTFPNRTQSVRYHLDKHGKGRTATEYTRDAADFLSKNKHLGQKVILKDGTAGIKIQTKVSIPGQKTQKVGGYWTDEDKLVTYWD